MPILKTTHSTENPVRKLKKTTSGIYFEVVADNICAPMPPTCIFLLKRVPNPITAFKV